MWNRDLWLKTVFLKLFLSLEIYLRHFKHSGRRLVVKDCTPEAATGATDPGPNFSGILKLDFGYFTHSGEEGMVHQSPNI